MGLPNTPKEFGARTFAPGNPALPGVGSSSLIGNHWRVLAGLTFLLFLGTFIVLHQTVVEMVRTWYSSRTFSHCFLVFPLSAYLIWRRRRQLAVLDPAPNLWGLSLIAVLSALWVLGNLGEIRLVQEWSFVGILVALVWTMLGSAVVSALDLPLAFLIFAVPFGLGLIGPLQDLTAWFAVHALTLSGIPAVLENRVLSVPTATWTVAETCSGIRYLFSSVMLGVIYAYAVYSTRKRRLLFMGASMVVPILANGARAYGIVVLAYITNNRLAGDVDHIVYGWVFFTVVQLSLFVVGLRWREPASPEESSAQTTSFAGKSTFSFGPTIIAASVAIVFVCLAPVLAGHLWSRAENNAGFSQWPDPPVSVSDPWSSIATYDTSWVPDLRGANRGFVQSYVSGQERVDLYWALYSGQRGFELLSSYNQVASPKLWSLVAESSQYETIDGMKIKLHRMLFRSGPTSRSVWTWYWVNGEYTGDSTLVKILQVKARLLGTSPPTCVLVVGTDSALEPSAAEDVIRNFLVHASFLPHPASISPGSVVSRVDAGTGTVHNVSH